LLWADGSTTPGTQTNHIPNTLSVSSPVNFSDQAGVTAWDSPIPEFVDAFPNPMPIIYIRARTGAPGVISDGTVMNPSGSTAAYQYDLREFIAYTGPSVANYAMPTMGGSGIGLPLNLRPMYLPANLQPGKGYVHNLYGPIAGYTSAGTPASYPVSAANFSALQQVPHEGSNNFGIPNGMTNQPDLIPYFSNPNSPAPANSPDVNYYGRPRAVDQFILISAGADGIYGTADDITSFGSVLP
jgi:hypothetical protein